MAGERSRLYDWMMNGYEERAEQMRHRDFDWEKLVKQLAIEDITDGHRQPPTVKSAKATFLRVRTAKGDHRPARRAVKPVQDRRRAFAGSAA